MRSTGQWDVAIRNAVEFLGGGGDVPEGFWYSVKRRLLGPPMVNEDLRHQRLSKPLALGVLSPDGISSSAYGTEEILIALLPLAGLAAFTLLLPMTFVILVVMTLVVLSYREVVMVYIRPGGSYVVARENFGPKVAQVAGVALLIDYIVTVAVQISAGTAAVVSAFPSLGTWHLEITVAVILLMCYGNLRGIKEAGRIFAVPTFLFSAAVILLIVVGLLREVLGNLHPQDVHNISGTVPIGSGTTGIITFAMTLTLLRAFANGGASLTGIEAVSDAVGAFRPPEGINARQVLVAEGVILGLLVAGISWMAHVTHAIPRASGYPTVLAQEANLIFGSGVGHIMFFVVQAATALILYTGGNTSFNGFPFLASYVAGDAFLPRWLLKRGHRLVFSNAIIGLTIVSVALVIVRDANVNSLVPMYAIGVFTAFTMAGFGMARYHKRLRETGWRHKRVINAAAGGLSAVVVAIFAVVKFTEGAWLVVVLFPILWLAFIRLNQEYQMEAEVLERIGERKKPPEQPNYPRRTVFLLVDSFDLATLAAMRYARSLRPTTLRAVHFVIDTAEADMLREEWTRADRGIVLDFIDCPDRRLARAAAELVSAEAAAPGTHVTAVLPRRSYSPLLGRLLHDRTADKIAAVVSRIPHCAATIVPFDVRNRLEVLRTRHGNGMNGKPTAGTPSPDGKAAAEGHTTPDGKTAITATAATPGDGRAAPADPAPGAVATGAGEAGREDGQPAAPSPPAPALRGLLPGRRFRQRRGESAPDAVKAGQASYERPAPSPGVKPIGSIQAPGRVTVEGRVRAVEIRPVEKSSVLACEISDSTGDLTALFYGRSHIPGIICGSRVRFRGSVGVRNTGPIMINPAYELLAAGESPPNTEG
ncbi:MAG TPA: amino acid permease [Streptosporangiaceae bacterium]|nr:amino acid permease [Streptosporangiaceae bacterium]